MKSYNFFLLFPFLLFPSLTNAQDSVPLITRQKGRYHYPNKLYSKKEIGHILKEDKLAWKYYKNYKESKNGVIIFGSTSVTLFGLSLIPLSNTDLIYGNNSPDDKSGAKFITLFLSSVAAGIITTGLAFSSTENFNKSIQLYNENAADRQKIGTTPLRLHLQYAENEIGLVLKF